MEGGEVGGDLWGGVAGWVDGDEDGEGAERGWSKLLGILLTGRTSTMARRQELGSNAMQDNNFYYVTRARKLYFLHHICFCADTLI